jgi:hypothetical protein
VFLQFMLSEADVALAFLPSFLAVRESFFVMTSLLSLGPGDVESSRSNCPGMGACAGLNPSLLRARD